MNVLTGESGVVNGLETVRKWSANLSADVQALIASNTKGAEINLSGNTDWTGSYEAYGFQPAVVPGEVFAFIGSVDGAEGVKALEAIVDQEVITIDIEGGKPIAHTVSFSGVTPLLASSDVVSDASTPAPITSIGTIVHLTEPAGAPVLLSDVRTVTLTLARANQAYVSSDTAGSTKRLRGNFTASVALSIYEGDPGEIITPNSVKTITITEVGLTTWILQWLRFGGATGLDVDREAAALVSYTLNGVYTGFTEVGAVWTEGVITMPDTANLWPE